MATDAPALRSIEDATARLLSPGSPFELAEEVVLGETMAVYKNRAHSLRELLEGSAAHGDKDYIVFSDGRRWSFARHLADVASVATAFRERYDIQKGDHVAILAANAPEWILSYWATISLGAVVISMNGWWAGDEIRYGLDLSQPKLLLADRRRIERLAEMEGEVGIPVVSFEDDFESLRTFAPSATLPTDPIDEDDPCLLLFTSGTTGRPKGALVSHRTLVAFTMSSFFIGARRAMTEPPAGEAGATLAPFPLFHLSGSMGSTTATLAGGATTVWPMGRFDPAKIIELSLKEDITSWNGATTHMFRLIDHPDLEKLDLRRFSSVGVGGSATTPELLRAVAERFPHLEGSVGSGYGSSETGGLVSYANNAMLRSAANCVGPPLPTVQIKIVDEEGLELPAEGIGRVCARSPLIMLEYLNNPEANAESFLPGRWVDTGDLGRISGGMLHIESRLRDMIIRGGENIYPAEIENRIELHPDVAEVAVHGVDDREMGQRVKAVIVPNQGATPTEASIRDFCAEHLAYFKVPEFIEIRREALPRNATGKVMKHVLEGAGENAFVEE
ncbi:MAG: acyl--CoA ligase [bacterium]|nr:fatty acid--CoA ligase [Deltaproteobacteria bacterium]MCP4905372.1 acyl--CoA ligase [bacterium]